MLFRYLPATFMIFPGAKLNNRQNNNILCKFEPGTDTSLFQISQLLLVFF
ncbi:MAG: hypothetical protein PWQ06_522 [Anaerophaga sp.]|nr:hypothetical protein [Anaerophaga sp.]MDN5290283.1 hypothetical protein [Anaerophaga sp.]